MTSVPSLEAGVRWSQPITLPSHGGGWPPLRSRGKYQTEEHMTSLGVVLLSLLTPRKVTEGYIAYLDNLIRPPRG